MVKAVDFSTAALDLVIDAMNLTACVVKEVGRDNPTAQAAETALRAARGASAAAHNLVLSMMADTCHAHEAETATDFLEGMMGRLESVMERAAAMPKKVPVPPMEEAVAAEGSACVDTTPDVTISINGEERVEKAHSVTYEDVCAMAGIEPKLTPTITYRYPDGEDGILCPGTSVGGPLLDGMIFNVAVTDKA